MFLPCPRGVFFIMPTERREKLYTSADMLSEPNVPYWFGARLYGMSRDRFDAVFEKDLSYRIRHVKHRTLGLRLHLVDLLTQCYPHADNYTIHRLAMDVAVGSKYGVFDLSREHLAWIGPFTDQRKTKQKGDIRDEILQEEIRKAS